MIFYLSKLAYWLLMPISWMFTLLIFALITKNQKTRKSLVIGAISLLFILSNPWLANNALQKYEYQMINIDTLQKRELAIILTGVTKSIESPDKRIFYSHGADRVLHAFELYNRGIVNKILVSGGNGNLNPASTDQTESDKIKQTLILLGMNPKDIITEEKSKNTRENALFTKEVLDSLNYHEKSYLVTSAFHLKRAIACFEKVGLEVEPISTDYYTKDEDTQLTDFVPSDGALNLWSIMIHEWIGLLSYKVLGYI